MKKLFILICITRLAHSMELADEIRPVYKQRALSDDAGSIDTLFSFNPDFSDGWRDILLIGPQEAKEFKEKRERKEKLKTSLLAYIEEKKDLDAPLELGDGETILTAAAAHKSFTAIISQALKKGASPNKAHTRSLLPLRVALRERCLENARVLIAAGAHVKDKGYMHLICSPLSDIPHYNATYLRVNLLRMLLQAGVDPNEIYGDEHETALYGLLYTFHANLLADIRILDKKNYKAFLFERKKLITTLLDAKLNPLQKDKHLQTALEAINDPSRMHLKEDALVAFLKEEIQKRQVN